jgi:hypothetical protein
VHHIMPSACAAAALPTGTEIQVQRQAPAKTHAALGGSRTGECGTSLCMSGECEDTDIT